MRWKQGKARLGKARQGKERGREESVVRGEILFADQVDGQRRFVVWWMAD